MSVYGTSCTALQRRVTCLHTSFDALSGIHLLVVVLATEISNKRNTTLSEFYTHKEPRIHKISVHWASYNIVFLRALDYRVIWFSNSPHCMDHPHCILPTRKQISHPKLGHVIQQENFAMWFQQDGGWLHTVLPVSKGKGLCLLCRWWTAQLWREYSKIIL